MFEEFTVCKFANGSVCHYRTFVQAGALVLRCLNPEIEFVIIVMFRCILLTKYIYFLLNDIFTNDNADNILMNTIIGEIAYCNVFKSTDKTI